MPKTQDSLVFKNELAITELLTNFRHENTWLEAVKSKPEWVGNDVIKIPVRGVAPRVLIDNTIYPIDSSQREDGKVVISLHKYETENTEVTTDELYALPYEKVNDVQVQHRETLEDETAQHALFSITPLEDTAKTPVIVTTGPADENGRKRLVSNDLINLKKKLDKLCPKKGRVLVLCSDHVADLLIEDKTFNQRYQDAAGGLITKNYDGFEIYESTYAPTFKDGEKEAYGVAVPLGTEASVIFHKNFAVKAPGTAERYSVDKANNPKYRRHEIGFELHWVCVAIKDEGTAAIISGAA